MFKKGGIPWNKDLTKETDKRLSKSGRSISRTFKEKGHPMSGKHHKKESIQKMKDSHKNRPLKEMGHKPNCRCFVCRPLSGEEHPLFGRDPRAKNWLKSLVNRTTEYYYFKRGYGIENRRSYTKTILLALYEIAKKSYSQIDFVCLSEWAYGVGLFSHLKHDWEVVGYTEGLLFCLEHDGLVTLELYDPPEHHHSSQRIIRIETVTITEKGIAFVHSNFMLIDEIKKIQKQIKDSSDGKVEGLDLFIEDIEGIWKRDVFLEVNKNAR